jgi:hypothetical protein
MMTRISKKAQRRALSPRKRKAPSIQKTGPKQDLLPSGFKEHFNALEGNSSVFIGKIK